MGDHQIKPTIIFSVEEQNALKIYQGFKFVLTLVHSTFMRIIVKQLGKHNNVHNHVGPVTFSIIFREVLEMGLKFLRRVISIM